MGRLPTGQLYPHPLKTRVTAEQLAQWEALMRDQKTDTAKALRNFVRLMTSNTPNHAVLRGAVLRVIRNR